MIKKQKKNITGHSAGCPQRPLAMSHKNSPSHWNHSGFSSCSQKGSGQSVWATTEGTSNKGTGNKPCCNTQKHWLHRITLIPHYLRCTPALWTHSSNSSWVYKFSNNIWQKDGYFTFINHFSRNGFFSFLSFSIVGKKTTLKVHYCLSLRIKYP